MTVMLICLAVVCWWTGHHLPAVAAVFVAASRVWPALPHHCADALRWASGTDAGSTVVLYALTFAIPAGVLAWVFGHRPRYRSFSQPRAARHLRSRASDWVIRDEGQGS